MALRPEHSEIDPRRASSAPSPLSKEEVLAALVDLPVYTWRYDEEKGSPLHLGPTAQDFQAAFGLGGSDEEITTVDAIGVLMVAVKALAEKVSALEEQLARQRS